MIGRLWHGRTTRDNADSYQRLLVSDVLPGIERIPGSRGAYLLRREVPEGVEFVTLTLFDSMDAVRAFAGDAQHIGVAADAHLVVAVGQARERLDLQAVERTPRELRDALEGRGDLSRFSRRIHQVPP